MGIGLPVKTIARALIAELPGGEVVVEQGVPILQEDSSGLEAAVAAARGAQVAVVAVGDRPGLFGRGTCGEGCDVVDLRLPGLQHDLVEAVLSTGTPTVLLVVSGRPYALGDYADRLAGIVQVFLPGSEGAGAVAGVLSGDVHPAPGGRVGVGAQVAVGELEVVEVIQGRPRGGGGCGDCAHERVGEEDLGEKIGDVVDVLGDSGPDAGHVHLS